MAYVTFLVSSNLRVSIYLEAVVDKLRPLEKPQYAHFG